MVSCWRLVIPNIRRVTCLFAVQLEIYSAWSSWWAVFYYPPFQFVNSSFVSICIDWSTADLSIEFQLTKSLCLSITKLFQRTTTLTCFAMSNFHGQDMCLFVCDVQISFVNSSPYWTTNLPSCDKRCDFKSKPIQPPLPPIVDPQVGSATKLPWPFPVLANIHLSQHIPQTSFSNFQWSNWVQASILLIGTFQHSPLSPLKFHSFSIVTSLRL